MFSLCFWSEVTLALAALTKGEGDTMIRAEDVKTSFITCYID